MIDLLRQKTREIEDNYFDCIIGTMPKIGDGSLDLKSYIDIATENLSELKRLLSLTGTLWLRIIDNYNYINAEPKLSPKSLLGIPQRVLIQALDLGLINRNTIYWHKPNISITQIGDRFPVDVDAIFMFTKSDDYYFRPQYEHRDNYITSLKQDGYSKAIEKIATNKELQAITKLKQQFIHKLRPYTSMREDKLNKEFGFVWKRWMTPTTIDLPTITEWGKLKDVLEYRGEELINSNMKIDNNVSLVRTGRSKRTVWQGESNANNIIPTQLITAMVEATCIPSGKVFDPFGTESNLSYVASKRGKQFFSIFENN